KKCRIERWVQEKVGDEEVIRRVYLLALCRDPTMPELKRFQGLMADVIRDPKTTRREVLEDLFWAVLSAKEFMFNR
ncbi:MAG TPA: hypothetical protein VKI65_09270, partial [Gemmataceae bacterium]|nr:hypothetical protein [Gemmataceae bacterium]